MDNLNLTSDAEVGDMLLDIRSKTYFKVTALNQNSKLALGFRYAEEDYNKRCQEQRDRNREADIVPLIDLVMHYKKVAPHAD